MNGKKTIFGESSRKSCQAKYARISTLFETNHLGEKNVLKMF
jgi:hypothetical protein